MISGINGFNANVNYDFSSAHERNLKAREEKEAINLTSNQASNMAVAQPNSTNQANPKNSENVSSLKGAYVDFNIKEMEAAIREIKNLPPGAPANIRGIFSLSGYTLDEKISVWGKISGLDGSFSRSEAENLKKFINSSGAFGFDKLNRDLAGYDTTNVDEFAKKYINHEYPFLGIEYNAGNRGMEILDSDMSVDEFKDRWAEYTVLKRLGESGAERISVDGENITIVINKNKAPVEFRELESIEYKDKQSKKAFIKFVRDAIEKGLDIQNLLEGRAEFKENTSEATAFKPIQATSKSKTYVDKDIRREFFENFLKAEREKGTDIMELLRKLGKIELDLKA
ncbi:hypothetical protein [Campylobacter showae]|uniref:hypothetical protein n=1 Tax=Campylobacter showae TaxID=204 RepID=UPI000F08CEE2|nr:hypothetical protein [Campylobacter showae]